MGFGGGGSGALPAHQHTNVPLSGGPLDMSNVTVGSLTAGSVVYSNGAALQELVKPAVPAGEVLSYPALATAPSWVAAGGATYNILTSQNVAVFSTTSLSFVVVTNVNVTESGSGGMSVTQANCGLYGTAGKEKFIAIGVAGVEQTMCQQECKPNQTDHQAISATLARVRDGAQIDLMAKGEGGGTTSLNSTVDKGTNLIMVEYS